MNTKRNAILAVVGCLALAAGLAHPVRADIYTFTALLSGNNEVPPVSTAATGTATLTVDTDNGDISALPFQLEFTGLSSPQTAAHIHQAPAGSNGPAIVPLPLGSPVDTVIPLTLPQYAALAADGLYVNVHTTNWPAGEIRGQLILTSTVSAEAASWGDIKSLFR